MKYIVYKHANVYADEAIDGGSNMFTYGLEV